MYVRKRTYLAIKEHILEEIDCEEFNKVAENCRNIVDNGISYAYGYSQFWIRKDNKERIFDRKTANKLIQQKVKLRPIKAPKELLKQDCKAINDELSKFVENKEEITGFVKNKDVILNAELHQKNGAKYGVNLDLENAFNQITYRNIKEFGRYVLGWNKRTSAKFARMMTHKGVMVQGNPLSPTLLNLFCLELDSLMKSYCKGNSMYYTRYADDICITSRNPISNLHLNLILNIIQYSKMNVNNKKTKFYKNLIEITGVRIRGKNYIKTCNRKKLKMDVRALQGLLNNKGYLWLDRKAKDGSPISIEMVVRGCNNWIFRQHSETMKKRNFRMKAEEIIEKLIRA